MSKNNTPKAEELRQRIGTQKTPMLLEIAQTLERQAPLPEAGAIVYSMACAELCRRLGLNAREVAKAPGGAVATLRHAALRA